MKLGRYKINVVEGDITDLDSEAIVNAANAQLVLGGGVAGAIRAKGGPSIQEECNGIEDTEVGDAVITGGGKLKAKYVIHAVGPRLGEGEEELKLANAVKNSLKLCQENNIKSLAFPAISAGVFGYPIGECACVMLQTTLNYLQTKKPEFPEDIVVCLFGKENFKVFRREMSRYDPSISR